MAGFISKQPNGLYCRFSTVVSCPTHWNMTAEDYIEYCKQRAEEEARRILENELRPFDMIIDRFYPGEMSQEEFDKAMKQMNTPATEESFQKEFHL